MAPALLTGFHPPLCMVNTGKIMSAFSLAYQLVQVSATLCLGGTVDYGAILFRPKFVAYNIWGSL